MRYRTISILALACAGLSAVQVGFAHPSDSGTCRSGYWRTYADEDVPSDQMIQGYADYLAYMTMVCTQIASCGIVDQDHYAGSVAQNLCEAYGLELNLTLRTVWDLPESLKSAMAAGTESQIPVGLGVVCGRCETIVHNS